MIYGAILSDIYQMEYVKDENGVSIVSYKGDDDDVVIPDEIDSAPVTKILDHAFSDKKMKYLRLPRALETIDHHAFSGCRNIQRIEFPESLRVIGNYAFYDCWDLREIHLPARLKTIGFGAFMNCEKMDNLIQDKIEGCEISIGSILNDLKQQMHVVVRHLYPDREPELAKVIFTEYGYEVVTVVSICRRASEKATGTGTQMRYCIGSQDIDYVKYDNMFNVIQREDNIGTIITVAVERLMFPYSLTKESRKRYTEYLGEHAYEAAQKFIRDDEIDKLKFITQLGLLDKDEVDSMIDTSISEDKTEYTAFLMDYRHKNFSMAQEVFEL